MIKLDPRWGEFFDAVMVATKRNKKMAIVKLIKSFHPVDQDAAAIAVDLAKIQLKLSDSATLSVDNSGVCVGRDLPHVTWSNCYECPLQNDFCYSLLYDTIKAKTIITRLYRSVYDAAQND